MHVELLCAMRKDWANTALLSLRGSKERGRRPDAPRPPKPAHGMYAFLA